MVVLLLPLFFFLPNRSFLLFLLLTSYSFNTRITAIYPSLIERIFYLLPFLPTKWVSIKLEKNFGISFLLPTFWYDMSPSSLLASIPTIINLETISADLMLEKLYNVQDHKTSNAHLLDFLWMSITEQNRMDSIVVGKKFGAPFFSSSLLLPSTRGIWLSSKLISTFSSSRNDSLWCQIFLFSLLLPILSHP